MDGKDAGSITCLSSGNWRSVKYEGVVYLRAYASGSETRASLTRSEDTLAKTPRSFADDRDQSRRPVLVAKAAAVAMQANVPNAMRERGVIVMTAPVAACDGQIGQVAYSASKGGIVGMTLPMARELAIFRYPRRDDSARPRRHTHAQGAAAGGAGIPRQANPVSASARPPVGVRRPGGEIIENTMLNGETIRLDGAIRMQPRYDRLISGSRQALAWEQEVEPDP
jgi:hypothetical protein